MEKGPAGFLNDLITCQKVSFRLLEWTDQGVTNLMGSDISVLKNCGFLYTQRILCQSKDISRVNKV